MVEAQRRERGDVTARPDLCALWSRGDNLCARIFSILKARVDAPSRGFCARSARALVQTPSIERMAKQASHGRPRPRVVGDGVCARAQQLNVFSDAARLSHTPTTVPLLAGARVQQGATRA